MMELILLMFAIGYGIGIYTGKHWDDEFSE